MVSRDAYDALMAHVTRFAAPRPLMHAAWIATVRELGGVVQDVFVDRHNEADGWFDARVRIMKDSRLVSVRVRASDAYILAVIGGVPIFALEREIERFPSSRGDS